MVQITLGCAIVGIPDSVFTVKIATKELVDQLKKVIKEMNPAKIKCDPGDLQLFLAKRNGAWLSYDENLDELLQTDDCIDQMDKMCALCKLSDPRLFGTGVSLGTMVVHVLVVVPKSVPIFGRYSITINGVSLPITSNMKLNCPPLVKFWNAFRVMSTLAVANAVIELPKETDILNSPDFGSSLYVRRCYPKLWEVCLRILDGSENIRRVVILGNPGIGKTYFGFFVLFYLAHSRATLVYESSHLDKCLLFSGEHVVEGLRTDFLDILERPDTFYVVDGLKPGYYYVKTILLTSPRKAIWYEFVKTKCEMLFMPVWTEKEILRCRRLLFSSTPVEIVKKRYRKWGGIARYCLHLALIKHEQKLLKKAIDKFDVKTLTSSNEEESGDEDLTRYWVLHYRVNHDLSKQDFVFASTYVLDLVYKKLFEHNMRRLVTFLNSTRHFGSYVAICDSLFERYVHTVLAHGGMFRARRLVMGKKALAAGGNKGKVKSECNGIHSDGDVVTDTRATWEYVELPRRETVLVEEDEEVEKADCLMYLQPSVNNLVSLGAMAKPNDLFEMTCSQKHPCEQKGLVKVLDMLGKPAVPRMYFVVPPDVFDKFGYQHYLSRGKKAKKIHEDVEKLEQFVLEVKLLCGRKRSKKRSRQRRASKRMRHVSA